MDANTMFRELHDKPLPEYELYPEPDTSSRPALKHSGLKNGVPLRKGRR